MELNKRSFYDETFKGTFNMTNEDIRNKEYIWGLSRSLGYEERVFNCFHQNSYFLFGKYKKVIPNKNNVFYLSKTISDNDFIFSFQELDTHLYIKDDTFKIQKKIVFELLQKDKNVLTFFNNRKIYEETKNIFDENKKEYLNIVNKFCFRLNKNEEIVEFFIRLFEHDLPKNNLSVLTNEEIETIQNNLSNFATTLQKLINNYFKNKGIEEQKFFNVDAENIENLIQYFINLTKKNKIEKQSINYINELINILNKILPSLAKNFNPKFDFFDAIQKRKDVIVFSENRYCERILFILNRINIKNIFENKTEYMDLSENPHFMLLDNLEDLEFLLKSQSLQIHSSPNRAFKKSLILSNTNFSNSGFASHNILRLKNGNNQSIYYNNTNSVLLKI